MPDEASCSSLISGSQPAKIVSAHSQSSNTNNKNQVENAPEISEKHASVNSIIIIEPQPDHREIKKFFSNDMALARAIEAAFASKANIINIKKNLPQKLLIITLKCNATNTIDDILTTKQIGTWTIKCRLPRSQSVSYGVIGPLGEDVSNDELTEALHNTGYKNAVATRIEKTKGKVKSPTSMFKVMLKVYNCLSISI